jgi:hypothetical protein
MEVPMGGPVVFISHLRVKDGMGVELRRRWPEATARIEAEKPRTAVFWSFLDESGTMVSIVHVFADAEAMDVHVEGADERARAAYEVVEPRGWEIYGPASEAVVTLLTTSASAVGVPLTRWPEYVDGFSRLAV